MVTSKQIAALRFMIFNAKDGTELSKRILAFLIGQSNELTKEVCLTLVANREGYTADQISKAAYGVGNMRSGGGTTHLDEILDVMGSEFGFSVHYGDFDPTRTGDPFNCDGQFAALRNLASSVSDPGTLREGMPLRCTFWFSKQNYSREAALVIATREELEQIDLTRSGLYPSLELAQI